MTGNPSSLSDFMDPDRNRLATPISFVLLCALILLVLTHRLIAPALFGLLVFVLTSKLAAPIERKMSQGNARMLSVAAVASLVVLALWGGVTGLFHLLDTSEVPAFLRKLSATLTEIQRFLPPWALGVMPESAEGLKEAGAKLLRTHAQALSGIGVSGIRVLVEMLICAVIGGMIAVSHRTINPSGPLSAALYERFSILTATFAKIVTAQAKISSLNTVLTACYLLGLLPLFGVELPYAKLLVVLTFFAGLLPVIGNLVSNTAIVLASLNVSFPVAASSLAYLVLIHKLEYFTNAVLMGSEVDSSPWELLLAMVAGEALFGISGVVAAPIIYGYVRRELKQGNWI